MNDSRSRSKSPSLRKEILIHRPFISRRNPNEDIGGFDLKNFQNAGIEILECDIENWKRFMNLSPDAVKKTLLLQGEAWKEVHSHFKEDEFGKYALIWRGSIDQQIDLSLRYEVLQKEKSLGLDVDQILLISGHVKKYNHAYKLETFCREIMQGGIRYADAIGADAIRCQALVNWSFFKTNGLVTYLKKMGFKPFYYGTLFDIHLSDSKKREQLLQGLK